MTESTEQNDSKTGAIVAHKTGTKPTQKNAASSGDAGSCTLCDWL